MWQLNTAKIKVRRRTLLSANCTHLPPSQLTSLQPPYLFTRDFPHQNSLCISRLPPPYPQCLISVRNKTGEEKFSVLLKYDALFTGLSVPDLSRQCGCLIFKGPNIISEEKNPQLHGRENRKT
jgi:hypothetical protein